MNTCCDVLSESQNAIVFRTFFDSDDGNSDGAAGAGDDAGAGAGAR